MFITFEGIDFCGKSTQVDLLNNYLKNQNKKIKIIREPGGTEISEDVRLLLLDKKHNKMFMETEIFLFSASRAQLVREKIRPYLEEGYFVISDRFHDSTTAYQGFGRGIPPEIVNSINNLAIGTTIPDITFFIDISVEAAEKRKKKKINSELDRIEISHLDFFESVRQGYLKIAGQESRFRIINGEDTVDIIHEKIIKEVEALVKKELV
jgi:dTMP kinase